MSSIYALLNTLKKRSIHRKLTFYFANVLKYTPK